MFKVAGPLWAQATTGGNNPFAKLLKTGKKVLRRVLQREVKPTKEQDIPKPTWSLRAQTVQVGDRSSTRLIGGLFPKQILKTQASELRRQAALRLIRDARKVPVFAFVGLSLGVGAHSNQNKTEADDALYSGIRDLFQQHGVKENIVGDSGQKFSLETLQLGQLIGTGTNAAVYEARYTSTACDQESAVEQDSTEVQAEASLEKDEDKESNADGEESCAAEDSPPAIFHTDDHLPAAVESDEDDDFCIISDSEVEPEEPETGRNFSFNGDGWVLYRVSSLEHTGTSACDDISDSESDIYILAGDEDGLESIPDLEDTECDWPLIRGLPPEAGDTGQIGMESTDTSGSSSSSSTLTSKTSTSADSFSTSATGDDPEPAPNIAGCGEDFPLAVKMMYNYTVESEADRILSAMAKETVPAQALLSDSVTGRNSLRAAKKKLPPHPNIVTMHGVFVDQTPDLPEGNDVYPSALPPRLNKEGGYGRNATMFLVMKKYAMTLDEYLANFSVSMRTRCLIFAQLLEGITHLGKNNVAHRDLKSNNILLDLTRGTEHPALAVSDFGCCLTNDRYGLQLPYLTEEMDKGGNCALMAPEIKCAEAGPDSWLDYSKSDLWAVGTLAYEIFADGNPFYSGLDARFYSEEDLPQLSDKTPEVIRKLVELMLRRDPSERPTPAVAATVMQLYLWAPSHLCPFSDERPTGCNAVWRCRELGHWLEQLTMETVCQRVFGGGVSQLDLQVKTTFLSRISWEDLFAVGAFDG